MLGLPEESYGVCILDQSVLGDGVHGSVVWGPEACWEVVSEVTCFCGCMLGSVVFLVLAHIGRCSFYELWRTGKWSRIRGVQKLGPEIGNL